MFSNKLTQINEICYYVEYEVKLLLFPFPYVSRASLDFSF